MRDDDALAVATTGGDFRAPRIVAVGLEMI